MTLADINILGYVMILMFYVFSNWLLFYTVRERLRVRWYVPVLLTLLQALCVQLSFLLFWAGNIVLVFLFFLIYCRIIDVELYKLMYITMVTVTYSVTCNMVFYMIFGSSYAWGWTQVLWMCLGFAITLPPMTLLMRKEVWPRLLWLRLPTSGWLIAFPAFVITVNMLIGSSYIQHLMSGGDEWVYSLTALLITFASTIFALMILTMMQKMQDAINYQNDLRMVDIQIASQGRRYQEMLQHMDKVRVMRHDMRHHLRTINTLLSQGKEDELRAYLREYEQQIAPSDGVFYSQNYVGNLIAHRTQELARAAGIEVSIQCGIPRTFWVNDTDLCVLLGNLTENALNACRLQQTGPRRIDVVAIVQGDEAIFRVENSCPDPSLDVPERRRALGLAEGNGFGMPSIRAIARKYNGVATFDRQENQFTASVLLYRPQTETEPDPGRPAGIDNTGSADGAPHADSTPETSKAQEQERKRTNA